MPSISSKTLPLCTHSNPCTIRVIRCGSSSICIDIISQVGKNIQDPHVIQVVCQLDESVYELYRIESVTHSCGIILVDRGRCIVE